MSQAIDDLEALLDQYWNLAFQEGQTGVSQGSKANEVLHSLRMNHHATRAEALMEAEAVCRQEAERLGQKHHPERALDCAEAIRAMADRDWK